MIFIGFNMRYKKHILLFQKLRNVKSLLFTLLFTILVYGCGGGSEENDNNSSIKIKYQLTIISEHGQITSSPAGIECGSTCQSTFDEKTLVSLYVTPNNGFIFTGWSGDCTGVNNCAVEMTGNQTVSANYQEIVVSTHQLTVNSSEGGTVTSLPSGINCGDNCSDVYELNTSVALSALADTGFTFEGWTGDCIGKTHCDLQIDSDKVVNAVFTSNDIETKLSIADMGLHTVSFGQTFNYQPSITGDYSICRKDLGHDDVQVDSETGAISWDTSKLNFGRGFYIRIKCSSYSESVYSSMVIHVDRSGSSKLVVAGENGISPYIGIAGKAMTSGDTLVFPAGNYPVSVFANESYENAFKSTSPPDGTATQFTTIISQIPAGAIINGEPQNGIGKQKNAFQLSDTNYVAIVGFVVKNVQRESFTAVNGNHLLIDFVGTQGAGTGGLPCSNFAEAGEGYCSNAGMRVNFGSPLFQNSYDWGHNRYGIMTRSTEGAITRRSFVRLDEHRGDQPYGGFSHYCDTLHLNQDNTVFDSLAISAPHYKNYAGLVAYPATGCENIPATLKTTGLLSVNNKLSLSLMDQKNGPNHIWDHIVSYDSEGTKTPQTNLSALWLLQTDKAIDVKDSFFGKARGFDGSTTGKAFSTNSINFGSNVSVFDVAGETDSGLIPNYLPDRLLYFRGRSDTFYGDTNFEQLTTARRWPIPGEDLISLNMRSYYNSMALKVGGGTLVVDGNRGATAIDESMSEYFWGYTNKLIPPLVVRVKNKVTYNRIAWEHLSGTQRERVVSWKVLCVSSGNTILAVIPVNQLSYNDVGNNCSQYSVVAEYVDGDSGIAYVESPKTSLVLSSVSNYAAQPETITLSEIGNNGSGITWHKGLKQYLVVQNNAAIIYRYDVDFNYLGKITKGGNIGNDTEGLSFVDNNSVMIAVENNVVHKAYIDQSTTIINGNYDKTPAYRLLGIPISNKGLEGIAVRPKDSNRPARVYACQEGTRSDVSALMKVVYFDLPEIDPLTLLSYDSDLTVVEPFNAELAFSGIISDCAGIAYDERTGHIIIVSQESSKAIQVDPVSGSIISELTLNGAPQFEGVTFGPNKELVFISEPNLIRIYREN